MLTDPIADMIIRKGPAELERIARAGELVAATIAHVGEHLRPGITTGELDDIAGEFIHRHGGTSASKGYRGSTPYHDPYPAEICISPNAMFRMKGARGRPSSFRRATHHTERFVPCGAPPREGSSR